MKLSIDYDLTKRSLKNKAKLRTTLIASAIILNLLPMFCKDVLNSQAKLALSLAGLVSAVACCRLPSTEYEEKLEKTFKDTALAQYKLLLDGEMTVAQKELDINNRVALAGIVELLPEYQGDFSAPMYGVERLISRYYIQGQEEVEEEYAPSIPIKDSWFYSAVKKHEADENINLEWLKKASVQSCFLAGKKGSGKSFLMRYLLLAYVEQMGERDHFYIIDPHYDPDEPWVQGVDEFKLAAQGKIADGVTAMNSVRALHDLLRSRITHKETYKKTRSRVRIFFDEIDSFSDQEDQQQISDFIRAIENQGRKYGFTIVVGAHSVKKGEMNIDSSVVNSMLQILFPSVLMDRNSILSGAIPAINSLKHKITQYKADKKSDVRVVGICDDAEFYISHVPNLRLVSVESENVETTATTPQDSATAPQPTPYDMIADWCKECLAQHSRLPNDAELCQAWKQLKGIDLTEAGLQILKEYLTKLGFNFS